MEKYVCTENLECFLESGFIFDVDYLNSKTYFRCNEILVDCNTFEIVIDDFFGIKQTRAIIDFILQNKHQPKDFWKKDNAFYSEFVVSVYGNIFEFNTFADKRFEFQEPFFEEARKKNYYDSDQLIQEANSGEFGRIPFVIHFEFVEKMLLIDEKFKIKLKNIRQPDESNPVKG